MESCSKSWVVEAIAIARKASRKWDGCLKRVFIRVHPPSSLQGSQESSWELGGNNVFSTIVATLFSQGVYYAHFYLVLREQGFLFWQILLISDLKVENRIFCGNFATK